MSHVVMLLNENEKRLSNNQKLGSLYFIHKI